MFIYLFVYIINVHIITWSPLKLFLYCDLIIRCYEMLAPEYTSVNKACEWSVFVQITKYAFKEFCLTARCFLNQHRDTDSLLQINVSLKIAISALCLSDLSVKCVQCLMPKIVEDVEEVCFSRKGAKIKIVKSVESWFNVHTLFQLWAESFLNIAVVKMCFG